MRSPRRAFAQRSRSAGREEFDAHRVVGVDGGADGLEMAGGGVNPKDDDGVGILVAGQKPCAGGINFELTRGFAVCRCALDECQPARVGIAREDGDAVVAAI